MAEELLQRLLAATGPAEKAALVAYSIIERENPLLVELIPVLAFLRWFDEPVVASLLPEAERERSAKLFASLIELPFVERVTYGYALHDLTRQGLLAEATTEQRLTAAQAAFSYRMNEEASSLLEVLYCTILGEKNEAARQLLEDQIKRLTTVKDYAGIASLFATLDEAESVVGSPVIAPSAFHWTVRGIVHSRLGNYQQAIADYTRAIQADPEYAYAYTRRGYAYSELGDYQQAIADYTRAIQADPEYAYAYNRRGNAYAKLNDYQQAIIDFQSLITLDEEWLDTIGVNYALILSYVGRYEEAVAINRDYLSRKPDEYTARYNLAVALAKWIGTTEAKAEISEAHEVLNTILDGENRSAGLYGLGGLEAIAGNAETALAYLKESAGLPDSSAQEWAKRDVAWLDLRTNSSFQRIVFGESQ